MDEDYQYMMGEFLGAFEDDELGYEDDELGRRILSPTRRRFGAVRRSMPATSQRALKRYATQLSPTKFVGSPPRGAREWPLGFPVASFVNAGPTAITVVSAPQRVFKGARLVIDIARGGATATGLVTITNLAIGAVDQRIAAQPLAAGAFAPNAFGVELDLDPAQPGIDITIGLALGAPALGVGDTVDVSVVLIGGSLS